MFKCTPNVHWTLITGTRRLTIATLQATVRYSTLHFTTIDTMFRRKKTVFLIPFLFNFFRYVRISHFWFLESVAWPSHHGLFSMLRFIKNIHFLTTQIFDSFFSGFWIRLKSLLTWRCISRVYSKRMPIWDVVISISFNSVGVYHKNSTEYASKRFCRINGKKIRKQKFHFDYDDSNLKLRRSTKHVTCDHNNVHLALCSKIYCNWIISSIYFWKYPELSIKFLRTKSQINKQPQQLTFPHIGEDDRSLYKL